MFETTTSEVDERSAEVARGYVVEAAGLRLLGNEDKLTHTAWVELGRALRGRAESSQWAMGDWLLHGGRAGRSWLGGSTYDKAREITGYSLSHLAKLYRVASAFPRDARRLTLAWGVHVEVLRAPSDMRQELLTLAEHNQWSADDLVRHIDNLLGTAPRPGPIERSRAHYLPRQVKCPHCEHVFPIREHKLPLERRKRNQENAQITCACGCGRTLWKFDSAGRTHRYVNGHNPTTRKLGRG